MPEIQLKGITWGHSRGFTPLAAAGQRFSERYPGVNITWEKRSLQHFADYPIERLTRQYDLLVIDHPWVGRAATLGCVLPLDEWLPGTFLQEQADHSVGDSHHSYQYGGHQWALAIDAATPVASYRPDLLQQTGRMVPRTWKEVLEIARLGKLAVPAVPIDLLMNFYMFCIAQGTSPFALDSEVIDIPTGYAALGTMMELYSLVDEKMFQANPIVIAEWMSSTDDFWYCPFAYGYSNYAREGYVEHPLVYADLVEIGGTAAAKLCSTIGGTGLAVSAYSHRRELALAFAGMVAAPLFQSTFYVQHGGQPGHRLAWENEDANRLTNQFFHTVLPAMERGYMRPRYDGYLYFQDHAGDAVQEYLLQKRDAASALATINLLYRESREKNPINSFV